jgi:hypothetical protein
VAVVSATEVVGVYDADGGLVGEAAYVWGRLRGTVHCSLCDITHSPLRRKPAWDRLVAGLPVPVRLLHRNELDADVAAAVAVTGLPVLLVHDDGGWRPLVGADELDALDGSVERLGELLRDRLAASEPDVP